jgi:hypothetical protein
VIREFLRKGRPSHEQGRGDARGRQVFGRRHHLLGALDEQAREADHVGPMLAEGRDEPLGRHLDPRFTTS